MTILGASTWRKPGLGIRLGLWSASRENDVKNKNLGEDLTGHGSANLNMSVAYASRSHHRFRRLALQHNIASIFLGRGPFREAEAPKALGGFHRRDVPYHMALMGLPVSAH